MKKRTALEIVTNETPDISKYTDFGFYGWATCKSDAWLGELVIGRQLELLYKVGQAISYCIIPNTGKVISYTTVQRSTDLEQQSHEWMNRMRKYDEDIQKRVTNI